MACKDTKRAEELAEDIRNTIQNLDGKGEIVVVKLNLSLLKSVRECAEQLLNTEPQINLLINNARVLACPRKLTEDGFEIQFGVNHLGHFLFTLLLIPRIKSSSPARIVNVSSILHRNGRIKFHDLNSKYWYGPFTAYCQSKLANVLFTGVLAKRLEGTGVTTYSVNPESYRTELERHTNNTYFRGLRRLLYCPMFYMYKSSQESANTTLYCAIEEKLANESGFYYDNCKNVATGHIARDPESARRLWNESVKMVGLEDWNPFTAEDNPIHKLDFMLN